MAKEKNEIDFLKDRIEQSRLQREKLLKQLTQVEETHASVSEALKNALLVVAELLRADSSPQLKKALEALKIGLKKEMTVADIEDSIQKIKAITFREGVPQQAPQSAERGFLDKLIKRSPADPSDASSEAISLNRLRQIYMEIIDELKLSLDEDSFKKLHALGGRVGKVDRPEDFLSIRRDITVSIQEYIRRVSGEREAAAAFIREIGERLIEVESRILESVPYTRETQQANTEFNTLLERQIGELRESVDFSKTLQELKRTVVSSLAAIQTAIQAKRDQDRTRMTQLDRKMEALQEDLQKTKKEIAEYRERAEVLQQEVLTDPLTGVYNRRAYEKRMQEELQRFLRHHRPFSVLLLDVDRFKSINDQYGHAVGDIVLKEIIKRIRPVLRESDLLARFGGEEFVLLLPETENKGAIEVAEKLRRSIENTEFLHRGTPVAVTISVGVTEVRPTDMQPEALFRRVDMAMYQAKQSGRNCVVPA